MKFGIRTPSLGKRIAARMSIRRIIRHSIGLKVPRGYGWIINPKRAIYNRVYNRTTIKADSSMVLMVKGIVGLFGWVIKKSDSKIYDLDPNYSKTEGGFPPKRNL